MWERERERDRATGQRLRAAMSQVNHECQCYCDGESGSFIVYMLGMPSPPWHAKCRGKENNHFDKERYTQTSSKKVRQTDLAVM